VAPPAETTETTGNTTLGGIIDPLPDTQPQGQTPPPPTAAAPAVATIVPAGYRLAIARLELDLTVYEGVDGPPLLQGPGHYSQTPSPGEMGNAAIAGHRTVKGKASFFYGLNKLEPGDPIEVVYPDRVLVYKVERVFLTEPTDLSVIAPSDAGLLTLTTCDPPGLDDRRLIVQARFAEARAGR